MRGQCADHSIKRTSFARGWIQDLASSSRKASFVPHALPYGNGQPFSGQDNEFFEFWSQIERDVGDLSVLAIGSSGKADGTLWMALGDEALERWRGLTLSPFDLDGDDLWNEDNSFS